MKKDDPEQIRRMVESRKQAIAAQDAFLKEANGIIENIQHLVKAADEIGAQLHTQTAALKNLVRKQEDEAASSMLLFASGYARLAGVLQQGIRRATPLNRVLKQADREREASRDQSDREIQWRLARQQASELEKSLSVSRSAAFDDLFGGPSDEELEDLG